MQVITINVFAQNCEADDIIGLWLTEEGKGLVEVYKKDGTYCGKIIWLKEPNDDYGNPKKDINNPNPKLKKREVKGIEVMTGFKFNGVDKWEGGRIYDPETGNTYDGYLKLRNKNYIDLRGYIGISLIGRTSHWVRYKKDKSE
ncbi:MAG: DUF2147 domain-containing protein [Marinilabiliales bacterium]